MEKEKLPDGWEWSTLRKECDINPRRPKDLQADDDQETSFVPMEAVDGDLGIIKDMKTVSFLKVKKGYTYFEENDMLFAKITPCMQNKKSAIAKNLINGFGFGTTEFHVLRCKDGVIPEWIYYFIRNQKFVCEAEANFTGSVGHQRVPKTFLQNYPLIVPPIEIQREIVDKLDKQMAQIEVLKKENRNVASAVYVLLESSINDEMKINNTSLSDSWIKYELQDICHLKTGGTPSKDHLEYFGGKIKWMVSGDINKEFIYDVDGRITQIGYENSNARYLPINSVLIALNGQGKTRGTVAILKTEATCNQSIIALISKDDKIIDYNYLFYYLKGCYQKLRNLTGDNERSGLSMRVLKPFLVLVPPIQIQKQIVENLKKTHEVYMNINDMVDAQQDSINQLPESILNEVFGKYELPDEV